MGIDGLEQGLVVAGGKLEIAVVGDTQAVEDIEIPGPAFIFPAQVGAGVANPARAAACTRAPAGSQVVGKSDDENVCLVRVTGQGSAHVTEDIGK